MNMMTRSVLAGVAAMFAVLPASAAPRQASQPAATMPSDAELRVGLDAAIAELRTSRLDLGLDGLEQAEARSNVIRSTIGNLSREIQKIAVDGMTRELLSREAVTMRNAVAPRLSGRIIRVGKGQPFADLADVQPQLQPGDLVILGEGTFNFADSRKSAPLADIAIVGLGVDRTTVATGRASNIQEPARLLLEGVRIDCSKDPLSDNRDGAGFMLRNCELMNYNSGAGGSNALYSSGGVVWIEGCLFDGAGGRSAGRGRFGNALDVRGDGRVFARGCQFVDNAEIDRATGFRIYDRCTMLNSAPGEGVMAYSGPAWFRDSASLITPRSAGSASFHTFTQSTDDVAFIEHVLDPTKPLDDGSRQLAQALQLHRRVPYWIGLIHHADGRIREIAATRVRDLTGEEVMLPKNQPREGERLADAGVLLEIEKEYARLTNWFDANRERLKWDEATGRYHVGEQPPEPPK